MLSEKNIVVTGANRGIGRAIVETCSRNGANVWACVRDPDGTLDAWTRALCQGRGAFVKLVSLELSDERSIRSAASVILSDRLPVDGIVNNAGVSGPARTFSMTGMDEVRAVMDVNFFGPVFFTQRLLKNLMRNRGGSIVNIASAAALDGEPAQLPYVSSKAALIGATRRLARELAPYHIRVNAVAPGIIETDMGGRITTEATERILASTAMKRKGLATEVADLVGYLLSERSSYMTGQVLRIDGGMM